jgi:hypothetical protein
MFSLVFRYDLSFISLNFFPSYLQASAFLYQEFRIFFPFRTIWVDENKSTREHIVSQYTVSRILFKMLSNGGDGLERQGSAGTPCSPE